MTAVYAVSLLGGLVLLVAWVVRQGLSEAQSSTSLLVVIISGLIGFGLGGMSAKFAGWPTPAHIGAAGVGAVAAVGYARWTTRGRNP